MEAGFGRGRRAGEMEVAAVVQKKGVWHGWVTAVAGGGKGLTGRYSESKHGEDVIDKTGKRREPGIQARAEGFGLSLWQEEGGNPGSCTPSGTCTCTYCVDTCARCRTNLFCAF